MRSFCPTPFKSHQTAVFVFVVAAVMFVSSSGAAAQSDEPEKPARPVNIRVVTEAAGSVTVAWDVPEGQPKAEGYQVVYRLAAPDAGTQPGHARWWTYQHETPALAGEPSRSRRPRTMIERSAF